MAARTARARLHAQQGDACTADRDMGQELGVLRVLGLAAAAA